MDCCAPIEKNYDSPVAAGTFRSLLGLILFIAGIYVATLTDFRGHGLGFLFVFAAPFLMLKDEK